MGKTVNRAINGTTDKTASEIVIKATRRIVNRTIIKTGIIKYWIKITIILTRLLVYILKLENKNK